MKFLEIIFYLLIAILIYFVIIPGSYVDDSKAQYIWYIDTQKNVKSFKDLNVDIRPDFFNNNFYNGEKLFYFDQDGDLLHQVFIDQKALASPSKNYYMIYNKVGNSISYYQKNGIKIWEMDTHSYPMLSPRGSFFVLFSTDNTTITMFDKNKNILFPSSAISSLVTDYQFSDFNENFLMGTIEGNLILIDYNGKIVFKSPAPQSKVNFIKSVSTGNKGNHYAALSGLYPEYLSIFNNEGSILWKIETRLDRRKPISLYIDEINNMVYEQTLIGVRMYDLDSGKLIYTLNIDDFTFEKIYYVKAGFIKDRLLFAFTTSNGTFSVLLNSKGKIIWKKKLIDSYILNCEIDQKTGSFLVIGNTYIYCVHIHEPV